MSGCGTHNHFSQEIQTPDFVFFFFKWWDWQKENIYKFNHFSFKSNFKTCKYESPSDIKNSGQSHHTFTNSFKKKCRYIIVGNFFVSFTNEYLHVILVTFFYWVFISSDRPKLIEVLINMFGQMSLLYTL